MLPSMFNVSCDMLRMAGLALAAGRSTIAVQGTRATQFKLLVPAARSRRDGDQTDTDEKAGSIHLVLR